MAYQRFLNNSDYLSVVSEEQLEQLVRDVPYRLIQAEQSAEMNFLEYLDQYYEIEKLLRVGKTINEYNNGVTYPPQVFLTKDGVVYKTLTAINGHHKPSNKVYWEEYTDYSDTETLEKAPKYSQLQTYAIGNIVRYCAEWFVCKQPNGYDINDIHIPGVEQWEEVEVTEWEPNMTWDKWQVCKFNGNFYTKNTADEVEEEEPSDTPVEPEPEIPDENPDEPDNGGSDEEEDVPENNNDEPSAQSDELEGDAVNDDDSEGGDEPVVDDEPTEDEEPDDVTGDEDGDDDMDDEEEPLTPENDDTWSMIGEYSQEYEYDFGPESVDYVVFDNAVYVPRMNPNADEVAEGLNLVREDPRNMNVVTHMTRIAVYYLHQLISPTNISETRRVMYEDSMMWLEKAARFKINPKIPRKKENDSCEDKVDWALATYQKEFNPNENMWLI